MMFNFITDSPITIEAYNKLDNYKIVSTTDGSPDICAIYFTSHDLYYPNTEESFRYSIYEKDRYEWTNCLIAEAGKHIFLRDVHKQWYLSGINSRISTPVLLLNFLRNQTKDMKVVTVGSSAGGYAAIRFGEWLCAERVIAFSPQIDFRVLLQEEYDTNPIVRNFPLSEINLLDSINFTQATHFVFYPSKSKMDKIQLDEIKRREIPLDKGRWNKLNICLLTTSHHGIPFPKVALNSIINSTSEQLSEFSGRIISPFIFAAAFVGWHKTIIGYAKQLFYGISKKIKQKINK